LSSNDLRKQYDQYGKAKAVPDAGFEDPSEFFGMIFGGDAFVDLIGEISLMKDLTKTMEIMQEAEEEEGGGSDETKAEIHSTGGKTAATDGETSTNGKTFAATGAGGANA